MIKIEPGKYYLAQWFFHIPPGKIAKNGGDYMACIFRNDNEPDKWQLLFRMRYYEGEDDSPWNDPDNPLGTIDRKSWYEGHCNGTEEEVLRDYRQTMKYIMDGTPKKFGVELTDYYEFLIQGDHEKFFKLISNPETCPPYMHIKRIHQVPEDGHSE